LTLQFHFDTVMQLVMYIGGQTERQKHPETSRMLLQVIREVLSGVSVSGTQRHAEQECGEFNLGGTDSVTITTVPDWDFTLPSVL
jgi:hypothetical protein